MRSFASGCTAMTGVEAVSQRRRAFKERRSPHARRTLTVIIALLGVMLAGSPTLPRLRDRRDRAGPTGFESVLSQLVAAVVGRGPFYYLTIGSVLVVLALSPTPVSPTSPGSAGWSPRRLSAERLRPTGAAAGLLAGDRRARRASAGLLIAFGGITDRLIPLFAVGAFLASRCRRRGWSGHWRKEGGGHAGKSMAINAAGAACTAVTLAVVLVSKFAEGAWVMILLVPAALLLFTSVHAHYRTSPGRWPPTRPRRQGGWSRRWSWCRSEVERITRKALRSP